MRMLLVLLVLLVLLMLLVLLVLIWWLKGLTKRMLVRVDELLWVMVGEEGVHSQRLLVGRLSEVGRGGRGGCVCSSCAEMGQWRLSAVGGGRLVRKR
jgi:hypothetical protein